WPLCYEAEAYVLAQIAAFLQRNDFSRTLAERMVRETGTLLLDWVDHLTVSSSQLPAVAKIGYQEEAWAEPSRNQTVFWHPEALLPRIVLDASLPVSDFPPRMALRVDSIADFM